MPSTADPNPTKQEVERQLERMLASDVFQARPQQARVFEFIVRSALAGREITEKDIRAECFPTPPYDPESTVARTTVNFIRVNLVPEYYAHGGEDDPVIVVLPLRPAKQFKPAPGKAYKPVFTYNPRSAAFRAYQDGMRHFHNMFSEFDFSAALRFFDQAIASMPAFAPAYAARAEIDLITPLLVPSAKPLLSLSRARSAARKALLRNSRLWRAHIVLGIVHACRLEWQQAQLEFDKALRLERSGPRRHPLYAVFLMAIGRKDEAVELVASRAKEHPEDPFALAILGLFSYLTRDYPKALSLLREAISINPRDWVACLALACLSLHIDITPDSGANLVLAAHDTLGMEVLPGLRILLLTQERPKDREALYSAVARTTDSAYKHAYWSPLQSAILTLGSANYRDAMPYLIQAFKDRSPYMVWLHIWPLFDPLHEEEEFKRLVARMRLPDVK